MISAAYDHALSQMRAGLPVTEADLVTRYGVTMTTAERLIRHAEDATVPELMIAHNSPRRRGVAQDRPHTRKAVERADRDAAAMPRARGQR